MTRQEAEQVRLAMQQSIDASLPSSGPSGACWWRTFAAVLSSSAWLTLFVSLVDAPSILRMGGEAFTGETSTHGSLAPDRCGVLLPAVQDKEILRSKGEQLAYMTLSSVKDEADVTICSSRRVFKRRCATGGEALSGSGRIPGLFRQQSRTQS